MAVLKYNPSLTLDLRAAVEKQRFGIEYTLGSIIPISAHSYEKVFTGLLLNRSLKRVLRRISSVNLEKAWKEQICENLSGIYIPQGKIKLTPCVLCITDDYIVVAIPVYIEGATAEQVEKVLQTFLTKESVDCKGHELRIVLGRTEIGMRDI